MQIWRNLKEWSSISCPIFFLRTFLCFLVQVIFPSSLILNFLYSLLRPWILLCKGLISGAMTVCMTWGIIYLFDKFIWPSNTHKSSLQYLKIHHINSLPPPHPLALGQIFILADFFHMQESQARMHGSSILEQWFKCYLLWNNSSSCSQQLEDFVVVVPSHPPSKYLTEITPACVFFH